MNRFLPKYKIFRKRLRKVAIVSLLFILILLPTVYFILKNPGDTKAGWYNASWNYRMPITITNNGSTQTNYVVEVTLDTKALIDATKLQSDCDDIRFTSSDATTVIDHFTDYCSNTTVAGGGSNAMSSFFVEVPTITGSTTTTIYVYYGNSGASSTSAFDDTAAATTDGSVTTTPASIWIGTGKDGAISISSDTNINTADSISSRACTDAGIAYDGDAPIYHSNDNVADSDTTIQLTSSPDSSCLAAGDEIIIFVAKGTSSSTGTGLYEFARVSSISTDTITLNRQFINAFNGTDREIVVQRVPNYTNVTTSNAGTDFTPSAWDGTTNLSGGVMAFRANGTVTVAASTTINGNALGYAGGAAGTSGANGGGGGESYMGSAGNGQSGAGSAPTGGGGESGNGNTTSPNNGIVTGGGGGGGSSGSTSSTNAAGGGGGGGYGFGGGGGGGGSDGTFSTAGAGGSAGTTSVNGGGGGGGINGGNGGAGGNAGSAGTTPSGGGVGGQVGSGTTGASGAGGDGSANAAGGGGGGGGSYGSADLTVLYFGSGGGGGGGSIVTPTVGTAGANGGGIVYIQTATLANSGTIESDGGAGNAAGAQYRGGGGAGAGGSVFVTAVTDTAGTITATGGAVASNSGTDRAGAGAGGDGRIHLKYTDSSAPTSTPTADTAQVPSLALGSETDYTTYQSQNIAQAVYLLDEGYGTTTKSNVTNGVTATISGATWQTADLCAFGKCLYFDGTDDVVTATNPITDLKSISFWVRPMTTTEQLIDMNGTASISVSGGTISATNFASPTIYVDGKVSSSLVANKWQHIAITTNTVINPSAFKVAQISTNYGQGFFDDLRLFDTALSADEVKAIYNGQGGDRGANVAVGGGSMGGGNMKWISDGLLAYLKLNESSGDPSDSSGNGYVFANNGTTTYTTGKYAKGSEHVPASSQYFSISGGSVDTYYFNASASGITDIASKWINDSNAFDATTTTYSEGTNINGASDLYAEGTTAPGSGGTITQVRARNYGYVQPVVGLGLLRSTFFTSGQAENLGTVTNSAESTPAYSSWVTLSTPSGGWSWSTVSTLVNVYDATANVETGFAGIAEVEVTSSGSSSISNVSTVSYWANPDSTTNYFVNITSSANITSTSGVLATSGLTNAKIYVNGIESSTLVADQWQHITVTTDSPITADEFYIGRVGSNYYDGTLDEIRVYGRKLAPNEIQQLYEWAPGPVVHWNFDENSGTTVNDISTNANAGAMNSAPSWSPGKFGSALRFDGTDDYLENASTTSNLPTGNVEKTVQAWFNYTTCTGSGWGTIGGFGDANTGNNFQIEACESNQFRVLGWGGSFDWSTGVSNTSYKDGNWHFVVITYDGTTTKLYLDGVEKASTSSITYSTTTGKIVVGNEIDEAGREFAGSIDDFRIYNYARNQAQIIQDMNAGHPTVGTPVAGPVAHYKFDEGALNTCSGGANDFCDSTPNANDLSTNASSEAFSNDGKYGKAYNGASNVRGTRTDDSDFDFSNGSDSFTLSVWFNRGGAISNQEYLVDKHSANDGFTLYMDSDGDIVCGIGDGAASFPEETIGGSLSANYDDTSWHHAVCVKNGTTSLTLYIDGKQVEQDTSLAVTGDMSNSGDLYIGDTNATDGTDEWLGDIDEIKIYRVALTSSEVQVEYNQGKALNVGGLSTSSDGVTISNASSHEYCVPGDTTTCEGPVAEWKMDSNTGSTAYDTSGNGFNGAFGTGVTWGLGKLGGAVEFNAGEEITVTDNSTLDMGTDDLSITAFINISSGSSLAQPSIIQKGATASSGSAGYWFFWHDSSTFLTFRLNDSAGSRINCDGTTDIDDGKWHHVAAIANRTSATSSVYLDGQLECTTSISGEGDINSGDLLIDEDGGSGTGTFKVDNLRLYKYPLTMGQLAWDANRGAPLAWWKFDETSGTSASDSAQNANGDSNGSTGTLNNTPTRLTTAKVNGGIDFDGSDDNVSIANNTIIDLDGNATLVKDGFSFSFWVYPHSDGETDVGRIFEKNAGTYCRTTNDDGTNVDLECSLDLTTDATLTITDGLRLNQWSHIVVGWTNDADDEMTIWVNGKNKGSSTNGVGTPSTDTATLYIGGNTVNFDGYLDEFKFFNYEPTQRQIESIMNESSAGRF